MKLSISVTLNNKRYCVWHVYSSLKSCKTYVVLHTERGKTLIQRKPTMYPGWKSSFDAHIYEGRVLQVMLMKSSEETLSEATVGVSVIAERCKKGNGHAEFWVDLQPSGKVMMSVQFFIEDNDQGWYLVNTH